MWSRYSLRLVQTIVLCVAVSATAFAQYGTGGTGSGTSSSTYTTPSNGYGSGKAIGIGVGVAVGVTAIALYVHHKHKAAQSHDSAVPPHQPAHGWIHQPNGKDSRTYSLLKVSPDQKASELLDLKVDKIADRTSDLTIYVQNPLKEIETNGSALASTTSPGSM